MTRPARHAPILGAIATLSGLVANVIPLTYVDAVSQLVHATTTFPAFLLTAILFPVAPEYHRAYPDFVFSVED
jgi:hypothetical protein